ncbi:MAG: prepilin-type N-terminal cleavage/methylation domain-containing protein [Nitrospira sp.]|nr:prepilin-type N-terminal cleavage/methylation domain-containing protein [Nitrospira sp.]
MAEAVSKPTVSRRDASARESRRWGFTLIELLVVVAILAILAALLLPALTSAKAKGKRAVCLSNLRQIGTAIRVYADDHEGHIPYGPTAPPFTSPASFYPSTGAPTSLMSLRDGQPVGLGLLLGNALAAEPRVVFCPGNDQPIDTARELSKVRISQAQSSYYYRHGGNTRLFDPAGAPFRPEHLQLDALGDNRQGHPIRALVMDTQFLCPPDLESFNVRPRTHHQRHDQSILAADGSVRSRPNKDDRFTVDLRDASELRTAFDKILSAFERADVEP